MKTLNSLGGVHCDLDPDGALPHCMIQARQAAFSGTSMQRRMSRWWRLDHYMPLPHSWASSATFLGIYNSGMWIRREITQVVHRQSLCHAQRYDNCIVVPRGIKRERHICVDSGHPCGHASGMSMRMHSVLEDDLLHPSSSGCLSFCHKHSYNR